MTFVTASFISSIGLFQQLLEGPMEVLLCEHVNDLHHSLFHLLNCLLPQLSSSLTAVWRIPYVSVAFFSSLKQNFIAYRSSKVSDCIFEIHQQWQSGFSTVYSNCCCSSWFEPEIIKIVQSSHKMYCNNLLNFQESSPILNTCTIKSGNLLNALRIYYICIKRIWHQIIYDDWYTIKSNQTKSYMFDIYL